MADFTSGGFLNLGEDTLEDSSSARILGSRELRKPRMEARTPSVLRERLKKVWPRQKPKKHTGMPESRANGVPSARENPQTTFNLHVCR